MLDINFIRENKGLVAEAARKKHIDFDVDELLAADAERLALLKEVETKRARQNETTAHIAEAEGEERARLIIEMQSLKRAMQEGETRLKKVMARWQALMLRVPNIPDMSVPEGAGDADNKEIRTWGEKPAFSFEPKNHIELMEALGMLDLERGAKVSGFRGYFLKGDGATLSLALWHFAFEYFMKKGGFTPMFAPAIVRKEPLFGTGYLPQGEEDLYKTQDDTYFAGTSEVSVMSYYMNEVIAREDLPIRFLAFSPCYRREAGSHGKDTKGIMRVHEFFKFEQVVLCEANHETSVHLHEELTANAEGLLQALNIPYRVVVNAGGDLGLGQVKKYDLEAWVPSEGAYRETHSSSYFHDFQTRRLNIRYTDADGKKRYAHSLNNTAVATPRILISLVENNQQEDGSILVPEVLRQYLGKERITRNV